MNRGAWRPLSSGSLRASRADVALYGPLSNTGDSDRSESCSWCSAPRLVLLGSASHRDTADAGMWGSGRHGGVLHDPERGCPAPSGGGLVRNPKPASTFLTRAVLLGSAACALWFLALGCATEAVQGSPATCNDREKNGDETGADCGGPNCPPCAVGEPCEKNSDCADVECTLGVCRDEHCTNDSIGENETDVDCGGGACPPCAAGQECVANADCASRICEAGLCQAPSCTDHRRNGDETAEDCGGSACLPCATGEACVASRDCRSGSCVEGTCEASAEHCENGTLDQGETGTDCGGECTPCAESEACRSDGDCLSGVCRDNLCRPESCGNGELDRSETEVDCGGAECGRCTPPTCSDQARNGAESDIDCGGGDCDGCRTGSSCRSASDCASGVCTAETCQAPQCNDNVVNGSETDTDCGGECPKCAFGERCQVGNDCETRVCTGLLCADATCDDRQQNGYETGVDCGGTACGPCPEGTACLLPIDCESNQCEDGFCLPASCEDGVLNGRETDIDCGGSGDCDRCAINKVCETSADCAEPVLFCAESSSPAVSRCISAACADGLQNGTETDIDCGGADCPACDVGQACDSDVECTSLNCLDGVLCVAPTCEDGIRNQGEGGTDCGGTSPCGYCEVDDPCSEGLDCASGVCAADSSLASVCQPPRCDDNVLNGDETDRDCGGSCPGCATGRDCDDSDANCVSLNCGDDGSCVAPSCADNVQNQGEADVDCGGPCPSCPSGTPCLDDDSCRSGVCVETCQEPTCEDEVRNGDESGVDCGGPTTAALVCPRCGRGDTCTSESDCETTPDVLVCTAAGTCDDSSCLDGALGGTETDVDCGGPDCSTDCDTGERCLVENDCVSRICSGSPLACQAPSCEDTVKNGDETDPDCGGPDCSPCGDGANCEVDSDCESLVCNSSNTCSAATCFDLSRNQDESDVDCGGPHCAGCSAGAPCSSDFDCRSGMCEEGLCAASPIELYYHSGTYAGASSNPDYIYVNIKLRNVSNTTLPASTIQSYSFRYYFVAEGIGSGDASFQHPLANGSCGWLQPADVGSHCDSETFRNCYFVFGLGTASFDLAPGEETNACGFTIHSSVVSDETNDFSYGDQTAFPGALESPPEHPWVKILVYDDSGTKILGAAAPY